MEYYYNKKTKEWNSYLKKEFPATEIANMSKKERFQKYLVVKKKTRMCDYTLYINIDDIKLITKTVVYAEYLTPYFNSKLCIPPENILNKKILKNIKEDFSYIKSYLSCYYFPLYGDYEPESLELAEALDTLTEEQKLFYYLELDNK